MNTFEKNVKIKLNSTIRPTDGETENYEMWLNGSFIEKSGKAYLRYTEVHEDHTVRTTVKMGSEQALILRNGGVNMRLPFNCDHIENGHYETQMGSLPINTNTLSLIHEENSKEDVVSGRFKVQYDLIISGQSVGKYTLEIQYSEGQS
ncbi:uncharacterized beta-barrel protein YwiB [Ureibacillus xyleni]|uniref:Uncharacterized beta-barrel protein YwiB n=1 Tax=Ureibacillus xyleni TaxID=614648 RepID=A0A285R6E1_9BACL|nr:DUF1934 domain-containing protein [Ureibacillus xyleni]SOB89675.1 uncharacterized beta-barrel protein YwiB [Ureibacillus xyleni]